MKHLIILSCLLVAAYGISPELVQQFKEQMMTLGSQCKGEVGAADDDITPMMNHQPPSTQKGKCFVACINKKMGFQDASGKVDVDGSYAWLAKLKPLDADLHDKMKVVIDHCAAEVTNSPDECDTALTIYKCVKKEEKAVGVTEIDWSS